MSNLNTFNLKLYLGLLQSIDKVLKIASEGKKNIWHEVFLSGFKFLEVSDCLDT